VTYLVLPAVVPLSTAMLERYDHSAAMVDSPSAPRVSKLIPMMEMNFKPLLDEVGVPEKPL